MILYREIIAVCSEIHKKHTNKLCGQKVEFLGEFKKFQKATISFVMFLSLRLSVHLSVSPSVLLQYLGSHGKDFHLI